MSNKKPLTIVYEDETVLYHVISPKNEVIYSNWSLTSCEQFCHKLNREYIVIF